jgi:hypothetical protein
MLGSWVRIPLRAWMFAVCMRLFCLLSCVYLAALRRADHSSKEYYHLWKMITEVNKRPGPWIGWRSHWKKISPLKQRVVYLCASIYFLSVFPCSEPAMLLFLKSSKLEVLNCYSQVDSMMMFVPVFHLVCSEFRSSSVSLRASRVSLLPS